MYHLLVVCVLIASAMTQDLTLETLKIWNESTTKTFFPNGSILYPNGLPETSLYHFPPQSIHHPNKSKTILQSGWVSLPSNYTCKHYVYAESGDRVELNGTIVKKVHNISSTDNFITEGTPYSSTYNLLADGSFYFPKGYPWVELEYFYPPGSILYPNGTLYLTKNGRFMTPCKDGYAVQSAPATSLFLNNWILITPPEVINPDPEPLGPDEDSDDEEEEDQEFFCDPKPSSDNDDINLFLEPLVSQSLNFSILVLVLSITTLL